MKTYSPVKHQENRITAFHPLQLQNIIIKVLVPFQFVPSIYTQL